MGLVMKVFGALLVALLLFAGMVHGALMIKGNHKPEAMGVFHDWPVIGGFFPKYVPETPPPTQEEIRDREAARWLEESRHDFKLPEPYTVDQIKTMVMELKEARSRAESLETRLLEQRGEIDRAKAELDAQREEIARSRSKLDKDWEEVKSALDELDRQRVFVEKTEVKNFKSLASIYEGMAAEDAAAKLKDLDPDMAAKLISRMTERKAGKILGAMKTPEAVAITKRLQTLTTDERHPETPTAAK